VTITYHPFSYHSTMMLISGCGDVNPLVVVIPFEVTARAAA
jgi:hypothetical protein